MRISFYKQLTARKMLSLFVTLLTTCWIAQAQDGEHEVKGTVRDAATNEPLIGAIVRVADNPQKAVAVTDVNGAFTIKLLNRTEAFILLTHIGYEETKVLLRAGKANVIKMSESKEGLSEVEVKGERVRDEGTKSLSQVSLGAELLERNSTASLGAALAQIDGVSFASMGANIQLPVIHGLYGNRILILNNGFKHGFQNWGNDHAPEIDIAGAGNITVVKGAAGVRYGPDALGGAIVVERSGLPFNTALHGSLSTGFQSNGRGGFLLFNMGQGTEKFSYHLGGKANFVGDRRAPDYLLTNTGAREYSFNAGARYRSGNFDAKVHYSYVNQNLGILRASIGSSGPALIRNFEAEQPTFIRPFSYAINEPNQLAEHHLASVTANWYASDNNQFTLKYGVQINQRNEFDVRRNAELPIIDLDLTTHDAQFEWRHVRGKILEGAIGVQVFSQSNINNPGTNNTPFIPNYRNTRLSAFWVENLTFGQQSLELGLRYDFEDNAVSGRDRAQVGFSDAFTFSNLTLAVGYVNELSSTTTFRANLGSGWRPPNMAELYSFGQHEARSMFGLLRYEPDEAGRITASRVVPLRESEILPEQSYKLINELEVRGESSRLSLSAYANYIRNFIFNRPIGVLGTARGPMPTFVFDQADALFAGLDATYEHTFSETLQGTAGASFIWSRNVQRDEPLINQPPINLRYALEWAKRKVGFFDELTVSLEPSYTFRQFQAPRFISARDLVEGNVELAIDAEIFDFQEAPPGYFLLSAFAEAKKNRFSASLRVNNALNTRYRDYLNAMRYFADDLGINAIISVQYKF